MSSILHKNNDAIVNDSDLSANLKKVRNPRTGKHDYFFDVPSETAVSDTVKHLRSTHHKWKDLTIHERAECLNNLSNSIEKNADQIAQALEIDTGRRKIAKIEVQSIIGAIRGWVNQSELLISSNWTKGLQNPAIKHKPQFIPYPVVGVISPWNFPLLLSFIDTIPALLAGCGVIIKPSEITPRFISPLKNAIKDSGLSDYLDLLAGDATIGRLIVNQVDAVCFTGSVATGRKVADAAAKRFIPAFLELGGKDPLLILEGANINDAVTATLRGSVLSTGQACQSIERVYVQDSIGDQFLTLLAEKAEKVRLNWPVISVGDIGPIISEQQAEILQNHLDDATSKGAKILTGGKIENLGGGLWLRPTVISNVNHNMKVMREETFGPIIPVVTFATIEEAINLANDSDFGLSAGVFARNLEEAEAIGRHIDAGAISLNDASLTSLFHEAEKHSFKNSGLGGSRMGVAGFQRFLRRKALIANTSVPTPLSVFAEDTP